MHHTDYSNNLRKAQHKTIKTLSLKATNEQNNQSGSSELVPAILAICMVIVTLFQMDPANADSAAMSNQTASPVEQQPKTAPVSDICNTPHPLSSILVDRPKNCPVKNGKQDIEKTANITLSVEAVAETLQFTAPIYPVYSRLPL